MYASTFLRRLVFALSLAATIVLGSPSHADPQQAPTVHLIAIGDTDVGGDFGRKLGEDAKNIIATFEQTFEKAGKRDQLKTRLYLGDRVTAKQILCEMANMHIKPNDTLIVLYSGHGAQDASGHILTLHRGNLSRKALLDAMKATNARLTVLLTDCCSFGVEARPVVPTFQPRAMTVGQAMEWTTMDSLFLRHQGLVDITAAEPGYCGKIDLNKSGSLFTNALVRILKTPHAELVRNLDKDRDGHMQWDEFLPQLRGQAAEYDRAQSGPGVRPQQAFATSLGRWMR